MVVTQQDAVAFARKWFSSIWTLELLLLMRNDGSREWSIDELIRELRASAAVVSDSLRCLRTAALVIQETDGGYRFQPGSDELGEYAAMLQRLYTETPRMIVREIMSAPHEKIQNFADAFRFRRSDP